MQLNLAKIKDRAYDIRRLVIEMLGESGSGHSAGPLGLADIFATLYFAILRHDPKRPDWSERDRLVLSAGHNCPALYATLALSGYFPKSELMSLRKINSRLQGHPHNRSLPGVEVSSGPLGQGISQAVGMALAAKTDKQDHMIFCICSDGEQDEGQTWEAVLSASKYKLNNLIVVLDRNNIQISGNTERIMPLIPLAKKYQSFGWNVIDIDGHSIYEIWQALAESRSSVEKPTVIIANTVPGKGVSFMQGSYKWHGRAPQGEEVTKALKELELAHNK